MKQLEELEQNPADSETIRAWAMEAAQFIFTRSQENLVRPMPWSNARGGGRRSPMIISDTGALLRSGVPPHWNGQNRIEFGYDHAAALWVEFGTGAHPVAASILERWAARKLGMTKNKAYRASFAMANSIRKKGIPPHPFLRPSLDEAIIRYGLKLVEEPYG